MNVVSWSGGKDSTATIILAHEHGIPIDEIVMAVLWFDKSRGISAILPHHWDWIVNVAKPRFEEWGYKVTFVDGKKDYMDCFHHEVVKSKHQERVGKKAGFPLQGRCSIGREKVAAINRIQKLYQGAVSLQGIAIDEPERLERMHKRPNAVSLLEQYEYTEAMATELCRQYGLLSPLYTIARGIIVRDGCWFCPNKRKPEKAWIKTNYPHLWAELEKLSHEDNMVSEYFSMGKTFAEVDQEVDDYIRRPKQLSIFDEDI